MGIDTKGVILTAEKDFWKVSQKVGHAIYKKIQPNFSKVSPAERFKGNSQWKLPKLDVVESFHSLNYKPTEYFKILFTWDGEDRMMSVHTDCDCDLQDVHGFGEDATGIIISVGMWGSSTEIVKTVLEDFKEDGVKCYLLENDSTDDWEEI